MMVVPVETEPTFTPGNPEVLFTAPYRVTARGRGRAWDVADDGRFLMLKQMARDGTGDGPPPQIHVVQNWFQELTERVPLP